MVFQNPDNQFVSSVVEDDVAFGPENYLVDRDEIPGIVSHSLARVDMQGYEKRAPHMLSGGQKQRVAIAGVLALDPDILMFDEATSMLDPEGRREVLKIIKELHEESKKTILMVTHYVEESIMADRIILMKEGKVIANGTPEEILTDEELLSQSDLLPPSACRIFYMLRRSGIDLGRCPLTEEELTELIISYRDNAAAASADV
jgi:energy-coupling factor transport system ATP-binding protein